MKQLYDENPGLSRVSEGIPKEKPGYYAVIPAEVRYDKSVPASAKLLYGEISALIGPEGYCYASNQYFAELYGVTEETISRQITKLERSGHIVRELIKDQEGQIIQRKIYLRVSVPCAHSETPPIDEKINTSPQKNQEGIDKKVKETNLSITDISKRKNKKEKAVIRELTLEEMQPLIVDAVGRLGDDHSWGREQKNRVYILMMEFYGPRVIKKGGPPIKSERGLSGLVGKLAKDVRGDWAAVCQTLEEAIVRGWSGIHPTARQDEATPAVCVNLGVEL